jgi:hypothetical protein
VTTKVADRTCVYCAGMSILAADIYIYLAGIPDFPAR